MQIERAERSERRGELRVPQKLVDVDDDTVAVVTRSLTACYHGDLHRGSIMEKEKY